MKLDLGQRAVGFTGGSRKVVFFHEPQALKAVVFYQAMNCPHDLPECRPLMLVHGHKNRTIRSSGQAIMTFAAYTFMAAMAGFFMWMMKNPGVARSMGLIGQKANFAFGGGAADWPAFLSFVVVMGAVGGLIMISVIVAFVFGREYTEGMAKNMLALPIPRSWFVLGKIVVSAHGSPSLRSGS